ncbi:alpha-ribazole phosphatase (plasmid) [Ralstonia syzygii subsp. celebesensis]|uniref:Alpha-ribazole phosphatase n=2 Tax=Ralstonia syzygii subsp. celebesensis TaxID=1310168 RepID=A0A1U9VML2_9RALS|nr:alpha-ribazole phosphatase [Ralstonia syzygii]AQW31899.1 alpha-ribazole phosphatase [blood disease bacterium A2-HR MARDI]QQV57298.1 alpha-ribazole phosphatase [Ralstonia syzygii subsp. celebesensis]CCA82609.1 putative phosphoglycerate mutase [blood disease bacterium R229]
MDIILIRHARPAMAAGLCYGRTDLPLDEPMDPDAASIADKLAAHPPQRLLASPLQRSVLTARALAQATGLPMPELDARLVELDFGAWEGCQWDDIPRAELDRWAHDVLHGSPHGGESAADLMVRVTDWAAAVAIAPVPCIWAVTHAGCMRALAAHWLQRPVTETMQWPLQWGSACGFRVLPDGPPLLLFWNR